MWMVIHQVALILKMAFSIEESKVCQWLRIENHPGLYFPSLAIQGQK